MPLYRITQPTVRKIALVKNPASGHRWHLLKSGPEPRTFLRDGPDWKVAYTVVAAPGHVEGGGITPAGEIAKDASGQPISDVWDPEAIRDACHSFAANGGVLSDAHFDEHGSADVRWAESNIAPVDFKVGDQTIRAGSWVLAAQPLTDKARQGIESGEIGGPSIEGDAVREPVSKEERAMERIRLARAAMPWTMGKQSAADDGCDCVDQLIEDVTVSLVKQAVTKAAMSTKQRKSLPNSAFAGPGRSYPIHNRAHAANALSRAAQNASPAVRAKIKAAVCRKYPSLPSCKS